VSDVVAVGVCLSSYVYEHPTEARATGQRAAAYVREAFSWDRVFAAAKRRIDWLWSNRDRFRRNLAPVS